MAVEFIDILCDKNRRLGVQSLHQTNDIADEVRDVVRGTVLEHLRILPSRQTVTIDLEIK